MVGIKLVSTNGNKKARNVQKVQKTPKAPKTRSTRKKSVKAPVIIIVILILAIASATVALGFYVDNLDTIFPNVSADGVDLSRLTLDNANSALRESGFESNADDVSATVNFPNGESFTITGVDAGFSLNAYDAARAAFSHGRNGAFFGNAFTYVRSLFTTTEMNDFSIAGMNEEFVRAEVAAAVQRFNAGLIENTYEIGEDSITLIKGTVFETADKDEVYELVVSTLRRALEERAHLTVDYILAPTQDVEIDLRAIFNTLHVEAVSAVYDIETKSVTQSVNGVSFDLAAAQILLDRAGDGESVVIPLIITEPEMTTEYLESLLFRDVLATRTTNVAGSENRQTNVRLGANEVDGVILNPGDLFCFNTVVGQRTTARGFRTAGGFSGGRLVDMVGGGICQVSSTIYDTVIHAGLEVVARQAHSMPVAYLPLGHDAAIFWGQIEFRFRNNTDFPIRIDTSIEGRNFTVTLVGTKLDDTFIRIEQIIDETRTFQVIERIDPNMEPGSSPVVYLPGGNGFVVRTYQRLYSGDGTLISRTRLARDVYNAQNRIIYVPPPPPDDGTTKPDDDDYTPGDRQPPSDNQVPPSDEQPPADNDPPTEDPHPADNQPPAEDPPPTEPPPEEDLPPQLPPEPLDQG